MREIVQGRRLVLDHDVVIELCKRAAHPYQELIMIARLTTSTGNRREFLVFCQMTNFLMYSGRLSSVYFSFDFRSTLAWPGTFWLRRLTWIVCYRGGNGRVVPTPSQTQCSPMNESTSINPSTVTVDLLSNWHFEPRNEDETEEATYSALATNLFKQDSQNTVMGKPSRRF